MQSRRRRQRNTPKWNSLTHCIAGGGYASNLSFYPAGLSFVSSGGYVKVVVSSRAEVSTERNHLMMDSAAREFVCLSICLSVSWA